MWLKLRQVFFRPEPRPTHKVRSVVVPIFFPHGQLETLISIRCSANATKEKVIQQTTAICRV